VQHCHPGALADDVSLELSEDGHHVERELPGGAAGIQLHRQAHDVRALAAKLSQDGEDIAGGPAQPAQGVEDQDIPALAGRKGALEFSAIVRSTTADACVDVDVAQGDLL